MSHAYDANWILSCRNHSYSSRGTVKRCCTVRVSESFFTHSLAHAHLDLPALSNDLSPHYTIESFFTHSLAHAHRDFLPALSNDLSPHYTHCSRKQNRVRRFRWMSFSVRWPDHVSAHPYSHSHLLPLRRFLHTEGHLRARNGKTLSCLISILPGEQHATHAAQPLNSLWRRSSASHILLLTHHSSLRVVDWWRIARCISLHDAVCAEHTQYMFVHFITSSLTHHAISERCRLRWSEGDIAALVWCGQGQS
jgi:hypothetical protein